VTVGGLSGSEAILEAVSVCRTFTTAGGAKVLAVRDVDLRVGENEIVGVLGESGSGKSTLAKCLIGALPTSSGEILVRGHSIRGRDRRTVRHIRKSLQMVFQNPATSLNPSMSVGSTVEEPLRLWTDLPRMDRQRRVAELLESVELSAGLSGRKARELSGGQQQRVALARALACDPDVIVLDEPTSALDVATELAIYRLLQSLRSARPISYVLISHDVARVAEIAERVLVMYAGRVVEAGDVGAMLSDPRHPYTRALIDASADGDAPSQGFTLDDVFAPPPTTGCALRPRCPVRQDGCESFETLVELARGRRVRCIHAVVANDGAAVQGRERPTP
jgi:oligopeptide transport system ATP-binding protein